MTKQELIKIIEELPDETLTTSLDRIAAEVDRARFIAKVQKGIEQLDRGEGIPHEDIEAMIDGWPDE